jgi:hypothetical protein
MKKVIMLSAGWCAAMMSSACSRSNNLLLGRVEATVGSHTIVVTDCYRTRVERPRQLQDSAEGKPTYYFTPCRDADIVIRGDELVVNGKSYGRLNQGDAVTVDHGKVLINERPASVSEHMHPSQGAKTAR